MPEIKTKFLFMIALEIQVSSLGETPDGRWRIFHFDAGSFEGPKLKVPHLLDRQGLAFGERTNTGGF